MLVYYSILGFLIFGGLLKSRFSRKLKISENFIVAVSVILLFVFAALRSIEVGADTRQYCSHFISIQHTSWYHLNDYSHYIWGDIEGGYKVYNKLLSVFESPQTITIANSFLQILLISILIFRDSKNKWLSVFIYFTFCFYQTALNLAPSSFVSYFIYLSFPFIKNKRLVSFLLFILIGMSFHTSAIFFLPLYFLYKIKLTPKRIVAVILISFVALMGYSVILRLIMLVIPAKYLVYISPDKEHVQMTIELAVYAVQLLAILFCFMLLPSNKRKSFVSENSLVFWVFLYETILYMFSTQVAAFSRGAFLFSPYTIIIIPQILDGIEDTKRKRFGTSCIVLYCIIIYIVRVLNNNVGTTMPYEFFFNSWS
ncbi:MAG: EpsG family protein [Bacteroides sp.]|nr:EpsG family protein [Eubacterium sp.]MCM1419064.1 EpsG family protein [Roseburia sp.]MCM1461749.1 EpsG family protein [Bacteroides sp.]